MARLAIFIDGGYLDKLAETAGVRIDYRLFPQEITKTVVAYTPEPLDLLRTYYYHCLPYQGASPTPEEAERYARSRRFFDMLRKQPRYEVREGRLAYEGENADGSPIFRQKRTDLLLGLDFALLSGKRNITHAAVVSGDSDLLPAFNVAQAGRHRCLVVSWAWPVHLCPGALVGSRRTSRDRRCIYAKSHEE